MAGFVEYSGLLEKRHDMEKFPCRVDHDEVHNLAAVTFNNQIIAVRDTSRDRPGPWISIWPGFSVFDLPDGICINKDRVSVH